jgi:asparagine synthase (glutamine-hydrolysing)
MRKPSGALPCYTFNGPIRDCADVRIARDVARACKQPFQTIPLHSDFFASFPQLAAQSIRVSDGSMDVTGAAELYFNQRARAIAPIRLTGNYGSEVVRGNVAFRPRRISREVFSADCCEAADRATQTYASEATGNRLSFIAFKQVPWHHYSRFAVERSQLTPRSPFLDHELMAWLYRAPAESATHLEPSLRLIAQGDSQLARIPTDRGVTYPPSVWANRVKRPAQEFLAKAEYAYDYGMPDWLARMDRCVAPLRLERLFLGHQKFCHFRSWYRRELAGFVRDVLLDPAARSRSHLNGAALEPLVTGHIRGTHNRTTEIHKLLSLELIHRELLA